MCLHTQTTKFKLRAQKCSFYIIEFNVLNVLFWLTICVVRTYRFWQRKTFKTLWNTNYRTARNTNSKVLYKCFIIKCFYKLKIQIQTQSSKMLFLHLQFNVFTTVLTHCLCRQDISFLTKKTFKTLWNTNYRTARNTNSKVLYKLHN